MSKIQFFSNGFRSSSWTGDIVSLVDNVRSGVLEKSNTEWARDLIADGKMDEYNEEKSRLFRVFSAGAEYDGNGFRKANVVSLTGYVTIDIDDIRDYETACIVRDGLFNDDVLHPFVVFVSPSGCGVKAIFKVPHLEGGGTTDEMAERYAKAYYDLNGCIAIRKPYMFGNDVKFVLDASGKDMTRCCFMSYDEDCRFDESEPLMYIKYSDAAIKKELDDIGFMVGNVRTVADGEYDMDGHKKILDEILSTLHRDENGAYIYNTKKRVQIGHRTKGTDVVEVDGRRGYDLMLALNSVAMFLFNNDKSLADDFMRQSFPEYGKAGWNKVNNDNGKCLPIVKVFDWALNQLEFKRDESESFKTKMTIVGDISKRSYISSDKEFLSNAKLPPVLTCWLEKTAIPEQFRDIRFYSALVLLSGFAVNQGIMINFDRKKNLNLQMLVIGNQGSGKSEMDVPMDKLLPSLNAFCAHLNEKEKYRHEKEASEEKHTKMDVVGGDVFSMLDDAEDVGGGGKKLRFENMICKPTYAGILRVLPNNNGKCVLTTSELSIWCKNEKTSNACVNDALKVFYDNGKLSNETATNIENDATIHCYRCNCAVLASGTPDQFRSLFTSVEGGELRRGLIFLTVDEKWKLLPFFGKSDDYTEIESFFLQWYFYHFYSGRVIMYAPRADDFDELENFLNPYVENLENVFGGETTVERAMDALIRSVHVTIFRIAALLQSLCEFYNSRRYDFCFNLDSFRRTHRITVWDDYSNKWVEHTPEEYIEIARGMNKPFCDYKEEIRELDLKYVWIAQHIVHLRLFDTLNTIETHDKKVLPKGVSDPSSIIYKKVLKHLSNEFTTSQYINAYRVIQNSNVSPQYITKLLNRLVAEGLVEKKGHGNYIKK